MSALFNFEDLKPKFLGQENRYNNWYFTVHFIHAGEAHVCKCAITEGTLMGQFTVFSHSHAPLALEEQSDVTVLHPAADDLNLVTEVAEVRFDFGEDEGTVTMGQMQAVCRAEQRQVRVNHPQIQANLTFTPRGPIFNWGHQRDAHCPVTENTRVSGSESLSLVNGVITINGQELPVVEGRGLFERVWFDTLSFFDIRATDWLYAHFDELYVYFCRTESVTAESRPFHFETGEVYMVLGDDFMVIEGLNIAPERWVYLDAARRFIPLEQEFIVKTDKGKLKLNTRLAHYPQFIQPPMRMEFLTIDNISGWGVLFYDAPIQLKGKFTYNDGRVIQLTHGYGMNEQIRISPL